MIDKYAERGLRSLAVARQACLLLELHSFLDRRSMFILIVSNILSCFSTASSGEE